MSGIDIKKSLVYNTTIDILVFISASNEPSGHACMFHAP